MYKTTMVIRQDIIDECRGISKIQNLASIKAYVKKNYATLRDVIDIDQIDNQTPRQRRAYMLSRICPVLDPKNPSSPPKPKDDAKLKPPVKVRDKTPQPKKKTSPKPKSPQKETSPKKPKIPTKDLDVDISKINLNIHVKPATGPYLKALKKEVDQNDNHKYSFEAFEKDIKKDAFVEKAIAAHDAALQFKLKKYKKLSKVDWNGAPDPSKHGIKVDLNATIKSMIKKIEEALQKQSKMTLQQKMEIKRKELKSIINDPDNGIRHHKGS